jgi:hypothetical protein
MESTHEEIRMQETNDERGTLVAFEIDKDTKKVQTLADFHLYDNGQRVYTPENKPSASDIGAATSLNARFNGGVKISSPSSHIDLVETDAEEKTWRIEGSAKNFTITEVGQAVRFALYEGDGASLNGYLNASGEIKSKGSNSYRMSDGSIGTFWRKDGDNLYLMRTEEGQAESGSWSSHRPFAMNLKTAQVTIGNGLKVQNGLELGGIMKTGTQHIKGNAESTVLRDHGNGNVTLSASLDTTGNEGTLYLGYSAGDTYKTKNIRIDALTMNKTGATLINGEGQLNSEVMAGPIRTEKDANNVYHTVVGGTDTVNRGRTIIAAGECGKQVADNTSSSDEKVHIAGDAGDGVYIHTGVQNGWGGASHKQVKFNNGEIFAVDGTKRVFRQGWDFGLGGKQGTAAIATDYTEDGTPDFNKLVTAGEFGISGNWLNGRDNNPAAQSHTGMVKVEVRHWEATVAYVQTYTTAGGETINRSVRHGFGKYPNVTWSKWRRFGPYESTLNYRMTIDREGESVYPYMTLNKRTRRAGMTGNYVIGTIVSKLGESTNPADPIGAGTDEAASIQFEIDKTDTYGAILLRTRDTSKKSDTAWLKVSQDGIVGRHGGKDFSFRNGGLTINDAMTINGKLNNIAFTTSNKQILNANSNDYVYVGNSTVKKLFLETDANGEVHVNANGSAKRVYHQGYKPTAGDVGALPITGGILTGALHIDHGDYRHRFVQSTNVTFFQGGHETSETDHQIAFSGYNGKLLSLTRFYMANNVSPVVRWGSTDHKVYHAGNKPTAGDVGAVNKAGDTMTGRLTTAGVTSSTAGNAFVTGTTGDGSQAVISAESNHVMMWKKNNSTTIADEFIGITSNCIVFRQDNKTGDKKYKDHKVYHEGYKPTAADVGAIKAVAELIKKSIDLNDYTASGFYNLYKATNVVFTNAPSDFTYGTLEVIGSGTTANTFATQILTWKESGRQMIRTRNDGAMAWGTWKKIYSEAQKPTAADVGAIATGAAYLKSETYSRSEVDSRLTGKALGHSKALSTEDLDTLKTAGVFHQSANSNATTERHYPVNLAGSLVVYLAAGIIQEYRVYNRAETWTRAQYSNGGWTTWAKTYNTLIKPTAADVGALPITGGTVGGDLTARNLTANGHTIQLSSNDTNLHYWMRNAAGSERALMWHDGGANTLNLRVQEGSQVTITQAGQLHASDVYIRSDMRLKSDLVQVENALDKVSKLTAYSYNKHKSITDTDIVGREVGLIAQDLQKVLPEAVNEAEDTTLTISNSAVNALLVEAIKELKAEIEELKRGQGK